MNTRHRGLTEMTQVRHHDELYNKLNIIIALFSVRSVIKCTRVLDVNPH